MELTAETIAVFTLLVLFAVDKTMGFLKSRGVDLVKMAQQIDRLDELHAKTDEDGIPVWYVRRSLEKAIENLNELTRSQIELLQALVTEVKQLREDEGRSQAAIKEFVNRPCQNVAADGQS